jgi:hypothetical protein
MEPAGSQAHLLERRLCREIRRRQIAPVAEYDPAYVVGVADELKLEPLREDQFRDSRTTDPAKPRSTAI